MPKPQKNASDFANRHFPNQPTEYTAREPTPSAAKYDREHGEMMTRAAREMTILLGDIIVTGSSTTYAIEFLLGGRVGITPGAVVGIEAARTVTPLSPQSFRWFINKYSWTARRGNLSEPLEIQTNGGTLGGKG